MSSTKPNRLLLAVACAAEGRTRVVLIHHPPAEGASKPKHDLLDRAAFAAVVARCGAELMLHGHEHKDMHTTLEGPDGEVPIFGVPSGTSIDERPGREGGFALFELGARTFHRTRYAWRGDGFSPVQAPVEGSWGRNMILNWWYGVHPRKRGHEGEVPATP